MNENKRVRVAITHGDTNGVGYELIFKTFSEPDMLELCTPIIYGSPKVATYHRNALEMEANFTIINDASEAKEGRLNLLPVFDEEIKVELGVASEESGEAGLKAIDKALEDYRQGLFDVLVTAPIDNNDKFHFCGQRLKGTDYLSLSTKDCVWHWQHVIFLSVKWLILSRKKVLRTRQKNSSRAYDATSESLVHALPY